MASIICNLNIRQHSSYIGIFWKALMGMQVGSCLSLVTTKLELLSLVTTQLELFFCQCWLEFWRFGFFICTFSLTGAFFTIKSPDKKRYTQCAFQYYFENLQVSKIFWGRLQATLIFRYLYGSLYHTALLPYIML